MRTSRKYLPFLALFVALIFAGCEGDRGPVGPPGDTGDQGEQGEQGEQGPPGTANVSVVQFSVDSEDLDWDGNSNTGTATIEHGEDASGDVALFIEQFEDGRLEANATVNMEDQVVSGPGEEAQTVTVQDTWVPRDGYLAIHRANQNDEGEWQPGAIVGASAYQEAGTREDVQVTLDEDLTEDQFLFAMVHEETNDNETFDFGDGDADGPYTRNDAAVVDRAFITVGSDAGVAFTDQSSDGSSVLVAATYFPTGDAQEGGWVAIYSTTEDNGDRSANEFLGARRVNSDGFTRRINVDVNPDLDQGDHVLMARLHRDTGVQGTFEYEATGGDQPFMDNQTEEEVSDTGTVTVTANGGEETASRIAARVNGNPNSMWVAVPRIFFIGEEERNEVQVAYSYDESNIQVEFTSVNGDTMEELDGEYSFKAVIIPEGDEENSEKYEFDTFGEAAQQLGLTERHVVQLN